MIYINSVRKIGQTRVNLVKQARASVRRTRLYDVRDRTEQQWYPLPSVSSKTFTQGNLKLFFVTKLILFQLRRLLIRLHKPDYKNVQQVCTNPCCLSKARIRNVHALIPSRQIIELMVIHYHIGKYQIILPFRVICMSNTDWIKSTINQLKRLEEMMRIFV